MAAPVLNSPALKKYLMVELLLLRECGVPVQYTPGPPHVVN